jgi:RNA polymerase sigma-70 factor (ECF subfamily)
MSEQLVERFEREALPHPAALVQNALRLTRHGPDAEDLVQETMLHTCAGFYRYRPGTNARAWLQRIMVNASISGYRKGQHEPDLVLASEQQLEIGAQASRSDATASAETQALSRLPSAEIVSALSNIAPELRQAIYLIDVEGFSYREAAVLMGTPLRTVMSRLHRGRTTLRAQIMALPAH